MVLFTLFSQCSSLFLSFLLFFFVSIFFSVLLSLIYSYLYHIFTIHSYLTPFLRWHLVLLASEEGRGRNLLSCDFHYSGHFLIIAADKSGIYHLMQMQQAAPGQKLPHCLLTSKLFKFQLLLRTL